MFRNFAHFFIKNWKLTFVLILIIFISGVFSYVKIPKQYNPKIVVPAFNIQIETNGLSSEEAKKTITDELENKIMEISGIDEVFWLSQDNFISVMIKFKVWEDAERSKIKLLQKINENLDLKPYGISSPIIKSINPEELPQITYAIYYTWDDTIRSEEKYIYLRHIANEIKNEVKTIKNLTTIDIVGWVKKNIIIHLDLEKLSEKNIDILSVYNTIEKNNINAGNGIIESQWERVFIETKWKSNTIKEVEDIVLVNNENGIIYLKDIAEIQYGEKKLNYFSTHSNKEVGEKETVFIGFWKQEGTNGVIITSEIQEKIEKIKKKLPKNIELVVIQDEWAEAKKATGDLIKDLIESIIIVGVILVLFLWFKNAINTATSIPLILSLVFLYSYLVWYDINRISLFALILVIGMLVDDSIVVVENIHRHLEQREQNGKTKLEAILEATQEVGPWVILSTITKILSFAGMFAVSGMMGEYMWPIPKFAIVALLFSILIAFSVNPWISYISKEKHTHKKKESVSKYDIRVWYIKFIEYFISQNEKTKNRRKIFKISFWISLILIVTLPVYFGIFKARMLPKSNKDQVYLWIDAPRGTSSEKMKKINSDISTFFFKEIKEKKLDIVHSVSSTIWKPFMWDFANLFRGGWSRVWENQISSRINLISYEEEKNRLKSEQFVIDIRPLLRNYLLLKYPDIKIRLLEDPPGPPVRATFMMKIKGEAAEENIWKFTEKIYSLVNTIAQEEKISDVGNSFSSNYKKLEIQLDKEQVIKNKLSIEQVVQTIQSAKNSSIISTIYDDYVLENINLIVGVKNNQSETRDFLDTIFFINSDKEKIYLSSIAQIRHRVVSHEVHTDGRERVNYIFAEMWDNSVVYPIVKLYSLLKNDKFLWNEYKVIASDFYGITYLGIHDQKEYKVEWDGEWKLTMDTFRDLWTAMIIALLAIYFLLVGQFKSFAIAGIIMLPFLLWFYGIFPWFSILNLIKWEYFNATGMIGVISLAGIVVWNAILLIDYIHILKNRGWTIEKAIITAWYVRFMPIMLTSISAIFWAIKITSDPVWSGLAWSIVFWLFSSAILTLIVIPIFYYESQKHNWK